MTILDLAHLSTTRCPSNTSVLLNSRRGSLTSWSFIQNDLEEMRRDASPEFQLDSHRGSCFHIANGVRERGRVQDNKIKIKEIIDGEREG
jgi:hypothetical protein